jgi:hypothetical protein
MSERSFEGLIAAQTRLAIALQKTAILIHAICEAEPTDELDAMPDDEETMEAEE